MKNKIKRVIKSNKFEHFLLSLLLTSAFLVRLYKIQNPIADWHSWRQADTASVTRSFIDKGVDPLRPRYHDISNIQTGYFNPDGYRFVEFPVYNLIHFVLIKALPNISFDILGRLVSVIGAVAASFALYKIGKKLMGKWGGILTAIFFAFIPYNIFFTRVILPDPLSVSLATISLWLFMEYIDREKNLILFSSATLLSLSILIKPHAVFYMIPMVYLAVKKFGILGSLKNIPLLLALDIALIPFFLWRAWMNQLHLLRGIPFVECAFNCTGIRFRPSFWRWIFAERIGKLILGVWGLIPFTLGTIYLKHKKYLIPVFLFAMFLYASIFASPSVRHDYYQLYFMPPIALALAQGSLYMLNKSKDFNRLITSTLLLFSIGIMFIVGWTEIRGFYNINHYEIILAGQAADKLLPKDALVIAPYNGDTAFLYQTRRWGWPIVNTDIDSMIEKGAQYYVSVNTNDADANMFKNIFETVEETDRYLILNLQNKL